MRKTLIRALIGLPIILLPLAAEAQQAGLNFLGQQFSTTITTANGFQNPSQLPQASGRQSCEIEYVGEALTATSVGFVFFGSAAPAATGSAFQIAVKNFINCENATTEVEGDAVWLSSTATNGTFVIKVK